MEEKNEKYYTTGEFAKKAGVTIRTIRYYDKKGLLKPDCRGENGYRLYRGNDFAKLQRILTLKYLGFPLENIGQTINHEVGDVELYNYEDSLIVNDAKPITAYLYSTYGNLQEIIKNKESDFERFIENEIKNTKEMFISKYSGLFICKKE